MSEVKRHESESVKKYLQYKLRVLDELIKKAMEEDAKLHIVVPSSVIMRYCGRGGSILVVSRASCPVAELELTAEGGPINMLLQLSFNGKFTTVALDPNEFSIENLYYVNKDVSDRPEIDRVEERTEGNVVFTNFKKR